jgi:uncharacterized protein
MDAGTDWDALKTKRYLSLETYRRSGSGVRTPVWFAVAPAAEGGAKFYVYAAADSGKAKRLRRTSVANGAACDARGKVTGAWLAARAEIVGGAEFDRGMALLNRKYWPWKRILDLSTLLFPRHRRIMIAIRPA